MGTFDFSNNKPAPEKTANPTVSKEDIFRDIFSKMAEQSPSRYFVAGSVFDLVRRYHDRFSTAVAAKNMRFLQLFFAKGYDLFLNHPAALGSIPSTVNKDKNDTNPMMWNMSVQELADGDTAFLCFMPIQNDTLSARVFGIIIGSRGDGYYYCMLNKDANQHSEVIRNKAMAGIETIGTVNGLGFELMNSFLNCISRNYYA